VNQLYYGDNLEILRQYIGTESVDLIYLDPPFNSKATYNVLFEEKDGSDASAQIKAFDDTWHWDQASARSYEETVEQGGGVSNALQAFRLLLGDNDVLAYLSMMAPRLIELHRVLKPIGSLYLHCDPTASHYLKILLDSIFGPKRFRAEIIWKRTSAHSDTRQGSKKHGHIHDVLLFYTKGDTWIWNALYTPYDESYIESEYKLVEEKTGRRFRRGDLTAAKPGGDTYYEWRVKRPKGSKDRWTADLSDEYLSPRSTMEYKSVLPYKGRYWAYSKDNMVRYAQEGRLRHTRGGMPEYKRYLDEMPGVPLQDIWSDINPIIAGSNEALRYPTQKPLALHS